MLKYILEKYSINFKYIYECEDTDKYAKNDEKQFTASRLSGFGSYKSQNGVKRIIIFHDEKAFFKYNCSKPLKPLYL